MGLWWPFLLQVSKIHFISFQNYISRIIEIVSSFFPKERLLLNIELINPKFSQFENTLPMLPAKFYLFGNFVGGKGRMLLRKENCEVSRESHIENWIQFLLLSFWPPFSRCKTVAFGKHISVSISYNMDGCLDFSHYAANSTLFEGHACSNVTAFKS